MTISDIDIWRAASLMVGQYGRRAAMEATLRSTRALEQEDHFNFEVWQRVAMAVVKFQYCKTIYGENVH
jgi:hypothetical protein